MIEQEVHAMERADVAEDWQEQRREGVESLTTIRQQLQRLEWALQSPENGTQEAKAARVRALRQRWDGLLAASPIAPRLAPVAVSERPAVVAQWSLELVGLAGDVEAQIERWT